LARLLPSSALFPALVLWAAASHAASVVDGLTFTYDFDFLDWSCSVTPGVPGCNVGPATVGIIDVQRYFGHSEFDLAGLQPGTATLTFNLVDQSAREGGDASLLPKAATFSLGAYVGDNLTLRPPNGTATTPPGQNEFGTMFATFASGANADGRSLLKVGDAFSFDVTAPLAAALARGDAALGIGLVSSLLPNGAVIATELYSFGNFQLTLEDPVAAIPEPGTSALMVGGLAALGGWVRRTRRRST
jgi:hypothetical protein